MKIKEQVKENKENMRWYIDIYYKYTIESHQMLLNLYKLICQCGKLKFGYIQGTDNWHITPLPKTFDMFKKALILSLLND